jgi:hypothetical protein
MGIALHWREEPFHCQFAGGPSGGTLSVFVEGRLVWQELVRSAAAAYDRAREVRDQLLSPRALEA